MLEPRSFAAGRWIGPGAGAQTLRSPVTGAPQARAGSDIPDMGALIAHATQVGGPALRAMGIHDRARMLKRLAQHLDAGKEALYALNPLTGATRRDGWIDIDGGIGTMFVYASKGRREMPDGEVFLDGGVERLSRGGRFVGRHVAVPLRGVAVHVNAFNFPVWGMLEKMAPALLAGVPVIVKPATVTSYLAEAAFRMVVDSGIVPEGAVQLVVGPTGDLLDRLGPQDVVSFTGSADTAVKLKSNGEILREGTRFIAEQDSLNASILGPDAGPGTPEFDLLVKEAAAEITVKAGQKCTAIRRIVVPEAHVDALTEALAARLAAIRPGDPAEEGTAMGVLVSAAQRADVMERVAALRREAEVVTGSDEGDPGHGPAGADAAALRGPRRGALGPRGGGVRARRHRSCPAATPRTPPPWPTAAGEASWPRCSPTTRPWRARSRSRSRPGTGGSTSTTATPRRRPRATARPCRT